MGFNVGDVVSSETREKEKAERLDRQIVPEAEHGMGGDGLDDINIDDIFGDNKGSSSGGGDLFGSDSGASSGGDSPFGNFGANSNNPFGGGMQQQQQQPPKQSAEDVFFDVTKKGGVGLLGFFKEFVDSFKGLDPIFWSRYGALTFKISIVVALFLFLIVFLKVNVLGYMVGAGLSAGVGVLILSFNNDKARQLRGEESSEEFFDINKIEEEPEPSSEIEDPFNMNNFDSDTDIFGSGDTFDSEDELEDSDDDEFDWEDDDIDLDEDEDLDGFESIQEEEKDVNTILSKADEVPTGMYTRQFMYESYLEVLTGMTPNYSDVIHLNEDDDEWDDYSAIVREAQEQMGLDSNDEYEDDLSELISVEKRIMTIKLEATRPKKLNNAKVMDFDRELTNLVSVENGEVVEGRYTKTIVAGSKLYTTIFLGENATVSVKDAVLKEKDFFLDTSNKIPVVLGFDHLGKTVKVDLFNIESALTAGMPRGGKSFTVKTALSQAIQFSSPKDLVFYFADVKGELSDWYEFQMPHVKRFESKPERILAMLTHLTEVEGERRKKIFRDAGTINYKAYRALNPDTDMPLIFVVIDEMTTLATEFDKDSSKKYRDKLVNIVTQLPGFGIRLWGIPHVVKNEVLPKTVSDMIACRMSVRGDEGHIEAITGAKPKKFPYRLTNAGDCAVKMPIVKSDVFFMHSFILARDDGGVSRILNYQTRLWNKLEPNPSGNSYHNQSEQRRKQDSILTDLGLDLDTEEDEVRFDEKGMF